jgi:hypothetical protein
VLDASMVVFLLVIILYSVIGHCVFFEMFSKFNGVLYRSITPTSGIPSTPRKLIGFVKEASKLFSWKQAVTNQVSLIAILIFWDCENTLY